MGRSVAGALLLLLVMLQGTAAQQVTRRGRGELRLDARLDQIRSSDRYRVIARDTFIARNDTIRGSLLLLDCRFVLEGTILGDVAMVDANVYIRPTARIEGDVFNAGSGFYRSEQAVITGRVEDRPLAPYHVEREGDVLVIVGDIEYKPLKLDLTPPAANRVDGIRPRFGASFVLPPMGRLNAELYGWGAYAFEPAGGWKERLQGGAEFRLRRGFNHMAIGIEETTATNDTWIRSDLRNTLSFLYQGKDYRNYFEAERQYVMIARELVRGPHAALLSLRAQREDGESLPAGSPWVLLKPDSMRNNPGVDNGVITSGILGLRGEWTGLSAVAEYDGSLEVADEGLVDSDFGFGAFKLGAKWAMHALANHTLELEAHTQGPLPGTDSLPQQRWTILGGSGTLYTYEIGDFRGDRLAFLETTYSIPLGERFRLPYLGMPALQFLHKVGMAWSNGGDSGFEQNVGARLQFAFVYARVITNPRRTDDTEFSVGFSMPRTAYPWEKSAATR